MTTLADLRSVASVPQGEGIPRRMSRFTEQVHAVIEDLKAITVSGTSYITAVDANEGLAVNAGSLGTVIYASGGLEVGASGFGVKLNGASLTLGASGLSVTTPAVNYITALDSNEGLEVTGTSLGTVIYATGGLAVDANGFQVKLRANEGLSTTASGLGTVLNASGGLEAGASGLAVKLDGASLALGASGLSVSGAAAAGSYGHMYISTTAQTIISAASTFYKIAGTTTAGSLNNFTMPTSNRLTYTGTPTITVLAICSCQNIASESAGTYAIRTQIAKNGTNITNTRGGGTAVFGSSTATTVSAGFISLATNDYLEAYIANYTDTGDMDVLSMQFIVIGILA